MHKSIMEFIKDEDGLTMVEYAVAGGMVAAAGVLAFQLLGEQVDRIITLIKDELVKVAVAP
jgi:pilus assembly protein Flp/PilA